MAEHLRSPHGIDAAASESTPPAEQTECDTEEEQVFLKPLRWNPPVRLFQSSVQMGQTELCNLAVFRHVLHPE